jgi:uncharacterized Zn finger protein
MNEIDAQIRAILIEGGYAKCAVCSRDLQRRDVSHHADQVTIQCVSCGAKATEFATQYPDIETDEELLFVLETELPLAPKVKMEGEAT